MLSFLTPIAFFHATHDFSPQFFPPLTKGTSPIDGWMDGWMETKEASVVRLVMQRLSYPTETVLCNKITRNRIRSHIIQKASILMQRQSYPTETVLSNKITRNRIVLSFKDSPRKPLGRRPRDSPRKPLRRRPEVMETEIEGVSCQLFCCIRSPSHLKDQRERCIRRWQG